jgi:hypothetical protein
MAWDSTDFKTEEGRGRTYTVSGGDSLTVWVHEQSHTVCWNGFISASDFTTIVRKLVPYNPSARAIVYRWSIRENAEVALPEIYAAAEDTRQFSEDCVFLRIDASDSRSISWQLAGDLASEPTGYASSGNILSSIIAYWATDHDRELSSMLIVNTATPELIDVSSALVDEIGNLSRAT